MHVPVMVSECLEYLAIRPDGTYLDATAGLGGHAAAIGQRLSAGTVIASDRDSESLEMARNNTALWKDRFRYSQGTFSQLRSRLKELGIEKVDGLLADLGSSSYQLNDPERGFSLQADGPLDMRMDRALGETAADLVNFTSEKDLAGLLYRYGEERRSRRIARAIVRARPIHSTMQLAQAVEKAAPRMGRLHPATQTFMALRRKVNEEEEELEALLSAIPELVKSGGRVVILTFMSLEDRLVKRSFQELARAGRAVLLNKHVVRPTDDEIERNPPSRSAKLRALEMR
jgi:16S rRNA (cytosine1402-N4)-methyltransferase